MFKRIWAILVKEFIQTKRDRGTLAMIIAIPLLQVILFGYAINSDPKHLPTAVVITQENNFTRDFIMGMKNSGYFDIQQTLQHESEAQQLLAQGDVQFVVNFPDNFAQDLVRGHRPHILIEADATDPGATGNALAALNVLNQNIFNTDLKLSPYSPPAELVVHAKYNPSAITQYNIIPGLLGVVITMTMVMITSIAITRERERGTMENLLSTPVRPIEVIIGKLLPYILAGYIQAILILIIGKLLFGIPFYGSVGLLLLCIMPFIAANLSVGLLFSSLAKTQLEAIQMAVFFFLPSILLSGFMFPFRGMPVWAQYIGQLLPLTHFLRIVRGIILKGNGWVALWPNLWPLLLFLLTVILIGVKKFKRTLD